MQSSSVFVRIARAGLLSAAVCSFATSNAHASGPVKLTASDAAAGDNFGNAVAISGDTMIVGANFDDDAGADSGSAYIYRWSGNGWTEEAKVNASDSAVGDQFGYSVALDGNTALIAHLFSLI